MRASRATAVIAAIRKTVQDTVQQDTVQDGVGPHKAAGPHRRSGLRLAALTTAMMAIGLSALSVPAWAESGKPMFLDSLKHLTLATSTIPQNGDQNPYAVFVAPVSAGKIKKDDVLVDNFNDDKNLQGLGTTIVSYRPSTGEMTTFADIPRKLSQCPGGVGLTTAMAMLKSGWVIVGSFPSTDGTTATKGQGCLIVLNSQGKVAKTITSDKINGPWGNMAVIDHGDKATLFVSNAGFGIGAPTDNSPVIKRATVLRLSLNIPAGKPPVVTNETVVADGFGEQADKSVFVIGPTGLALGKNGVLYVSDAIGNRIVSIPDAATRTDSAGTGKRLTEGNLLKRPLALVTAPNGHLLVTNGLNGQVVEIDPATGKQLGAKWIDEDKAQQPPGSGDLFGLTIAPDGKGFYYVQDDVNAIVLAH